MQDDELDEKGPPPNPAATTVTSNTALLARGGEWIVDSGSSFDIISPAEMTAAERKRIYALDNPVPLNTAQGEAAADKAVSLTPFNDGSKVECLIMPHSPALLSLGRLCIDGDCSFVWQKDSAHG